MRIAYFDCFNGAAGDMILAALIDAGCPVEALRGAIARLQLPGVQLVVEKTKRGGIAATHVRVDIAAAAERKHRHLSSIRKIIQAAALPAEVTVRALTIFERLAQAEAAVHGTTLEKVHFHEVGADDAIVDIVGACAALHELRIERVACSAIPTGSGTVQCEHGLMPVPAPATARLLAGAPIARSEEPFELTTPTGAAILTTLASEFGPLPAMTLESSGIGAGTRETATRANILRVLIGTATGAESATSDSVCVIQTQVDDVSGQVTAHAAARLLEAGALDCYLTPIIMKKGRPGLLMTTLATAALAERLEKLMMTELGTLGTRRYVAQRRKMARRVIPVQTPFGEIRVKSGYLDDKRAHARPEYEDCAAAAARHGVAITEVQQAALRAIEAYSEGAGTRGASAC